MGILLQRACGVVRGSADGQATQAGGSRQRRRTPNAQGVSRSEALATGDGADIVQGAAGDPTSRHDALARSGNRGTRTGSRLRGARRHDMRGELLGLSAIRALRVHRTTRRICLGQIEGGGQRRSGRRRPGDVADGRSGRHRCLGRGRMVPCEPRIRSARSRAKFGRAMGRMDRVAEAHHTVQGPTRMSTTLTALERLQQAITTPTNGVLGLVDVLLDIARQHPLQLRWRAGDCCVCLHDGEPSNGINVPLRKSVVRAALARVAVLCNQRQAHSVSPYRGQGEILVGAAPATAVRVEFVNTPDEQALGMAPVPSNGMLPATDSACGGQCE